MFLHGIIGRDRRAHIALLTALTFIAALLAGAVPARAADPTPEQAFTLLKRDLQGLVDEAATKNVRMGISVTDLAHVVGGDTITVGDQEPYKAASVIKLPLLALLMDLADKGQLSLDESVTIPAGSSNIVGGSGTLRLREFPLDITVRELMELMVQVSDNTATNVLIDRAGGFDAINEYIDGLGYDTMWLGRKMIHTAVPPLQENWLNSSEVTDFLVRLYDHDFLSASSSEHIIDLMKGQLVNTKFGAVIPRDVLANKTGELGDASHDSGYILIDGREVALTATTAFSAPFTLAEANVYVQRAATFVYDFARTPLSEAGPTNAEKIAALRESESAKRTEATAAEDKRTALNKDLIATEARVQDAQAALTAAKNSSTNAEKAAKTAAKKTVKAKSAAKKASKKKAAATKKAAKAKKRYAAVKTAKTKKALTKANKTAKTAKKKAAKKSKALLVAKLAQKTADSAAKTARTTLTRAQASLKTLTDKQTRLSTEVASLTTQLDGLLAEVESLRLEADALEGVSSKASTLAEILAGRAIPGAQVVYTKNGVTEKYEYGVQNTRTGIPVEEDTIFQAASLSKVVGSYIFLKRVDQGVIDLDTPLWEYYESPRTAGNELAKTVTARMVLNHTTGFPNWAGAVGSDTPLVPQWTPGTKYGYSGDGFFLLQQTIEHLDGKSFAQTMKEEVFEPFGMTNSTLVTLPENFSRTIVGHSAAGVAGSVSNYVNGNTAYTLQTTATDYDKFIQHALLGGEGLKPETHALWTTESSDAVRSATNGANPYIKWGLGVGLQTNANGKALWHWGDNGDRKAFFIAYPERNESIAIFWNSANGQQSANQILSLFLGPQAFHAVTWVG
ncbi:hypothetical protein GCM10010401_12200 [Rarobacter faecitabidus]|uniref:CubicO group peptidase (Beta-lactamase class C family) n=1 Tax=Rarobacter faecitabidus TaxID=13243 RepID=A0A542ZNW4_RARFA|nr:serine hydrolase [Rarobacter faecitabidus]TQL62042.1 CubicO group peptidase (beta-lactamase class C family) [Rarobacter faecitabidus]